MCALGTHSISFIGFHYWRANWDVLEKTFQVPDFITSCFKFHLKGTVYLREAYCELEKVIFSEDDLVSIVTGTPGVGKSVFTLYLLHKLIKSDKKVAYQYGTHNFIFDGIHPRQVELTIFEVFVTTGCDFYLYDPCETGKGPISSYKGRCVVFCSPRRENYASVKTIRKTFYMPIWSYTKAEECRSLCYSSMDEKELLT